jgi:hypothetical protein
MVPPHVQPLILPSIESVADFTSRPLYVISSGELGTTAAAVEQQLSYIFRLAAIWDAIVLIDEADVFLEQRSPHDLQRNALVAGAFEISYMLSQR